jgi:hypothetical protein
MITGKYRKAEYDHVEENEEDPTDATDNKSQLHELLSLSRRFLGCSGVSCRQAAIDASGENNRRDGQWPATEDRNDCRH